LPDSVRTTLFSQIRQVLDGEIQDAAFAHLTPALRQAITAILMDTMPAILAN